MDWLDSLIVTGVACAILIIIELWLWDH